MYCRNFLIFYKAINYDAYYTTNKFIYYVQVIFFFIVLYNYEIHTQIIIIVTTSILHTTHLFTMTPQKTQYGIMLKN